MYPFVENKTHITVSTEGIGFHSSLTAGNLLKPAYASNLFFDYPRPYSFAHRLLNLLGSIFEGFLIENMAGSLQQAVVYCSLSFGNCHDNNLSAFK